MEGCMRTARYKDAIEIGEVTQDIEKSQKFGGKNVSEVYTQTKRKV